MALVLFAFIYWQTAMQERAKIDGVIMREVQFLLRPQAGEVGRQLQMWLETDIHGMLYGAVFRPDGSREVGNLLAVPKGLVADGMPHDAIFGPIARDRNGGDPELVRGVATRLMDGRLLVIGFDTDELEELHDTIVRALSLSLVPMTLLSLGGGMLLTLRAQRRLGEVHVAVDRIMAGALQERLPVRSTSDELGKVSAAVNRMLDKIEYLVHELRGVGDAIAHDLRTPLTRVRIRLERSREEATTRGEFQAATDRAITSVDAALAVIGAVLRISEIEHGQRRAAFNPVELAGVLTDVAELYEPFAEERGIRLEVQATAGLVVSGDRDLLVEAIGNLVDNAVKFAPAASVVSIKLKSWGNKALVQVIDLGPGIPLEERDRVLQRFYRSEKSRTIEGSGLGLSIVTAVVALHGFEMKIEDARPGCMVEIVCPELLQDSPLITSLTSKSKMDHTNVPAAA